jgi:hypothetical protein
VRCHPRNRSSSTAVAEWVSGPSRSARIARSATRGVGCRLSSGPPPVTTGSATLRGVFRNAVTDVYTTPTGGGEVRLGSNRHSARPRSEPAQQVTEPPPWSTPRRVRSSTTASRVELTVDSSHRGRVTIPDVVGAVSREERSDRRPATTTRLPPCRIGRRVVCESTVLPPPTLDLFTKTQK